MFGKSKKGLISYRDLEKKYNSLELDYEILIEKTSSELYKTIIDGDFNLKYENDCLREQNKDLRKTIKKLKNEIKELNSVYKK
jgi:archaellum component FlaC